MTRPLVVLRPEPGLGETLAEARARGLGAVGAPLFAIEPVAWTLAEPGRFDAILAGSANSFRHGGPGLAALRHLPVHAVGARTAAAAREAGFTVAGEGTSDLQTVLDRLAGPARFLRLAGEERVALAAPAGIAIEELVLYRAARHPLGAEGEVALRAGGVALLHSGAAARALAAECERLVIPRAPVTLAALAPRIAEAAGSGWGAVKVANAVTDAALLALAAELCQ